jgi:hypothetical protein
LTSHSLARFFAGISVSLCASIVSAARARKRLLATRLNALGTNRGPTSYLLVSNRD